MILEGIVTTCDAAGRMHLAAMGPHVDEREVRTAAIERLTLKPYDTSQTAANLAAVPEGVFHLTDDVLLFARAVTKSFSVPPPARPAAQVRGWVLEEACRAYEFRIEASDTSGSRLRHDARVVVVHEGRPFVGFNRARHAVVEAAILCTRLHLLGAGEVRRQMAALEPLVEKTAGSREHEAWALIVGHVEGGNRPPAC